MRHFSEVWGVFWEIWRDNAEANVLEKSEGVAQNGGKSDMTEENPRASV